MPDPIRVLVADDHTIVRAGVRMLLEAEPDVRVVGEAREGGQALALAEALRPDVVVMDVAMPGMDGLEATRRIKTQLSDVNVLVLTMHRSDEYLIEMLKAGASGYVLKGAETSDLINAVRVVARGEVFLYPTMAGHLVQSFLSREKGSARVNQTLSPRETEVLRLLAEGYSTKDIAAQLIVSPSTVHTHRRNLMGKLGLNSRHELIQYARRHGLISSD